MMTVTDDIADRLAVWWNIDRRSDRLCALRAIVRAWREDKYLENRAPNDDEKPIALHLAKRGCRRPHRS